MTLNLNRKLTQPTVGLWNRLEPRPTKHNFSRVLSVETYDPLWMLNRQWQFGEFKGEDTGSAVFSQIQLRNSKISRYASGNKDFTNEAVEVFNNEVPLEAKIEGEAVGFDLKTHLQISVYWKRLLSATYEPTPTTYSNLLDAFQANYTLATPSFANEEEEANHKVHLRASVLRQTASTKWLLDTKQLYQDFSTQIQSGQTIESLLLLNAPGLSLVERSKLDQIATDFVQWFEQLWGQPQTKSSWNGNRLEYQFANTVPRSLPVLSQQTLLADEYYHGKLDWYVYDLDNTNTILNSATPLSGEDRESVTVTRTMFPSAVRFQGMPVARWWEFEEGSIDFGKIYSNTNDTAHILLAQFGLIYSNDWQIIPFKVPVGSLSEIEKLLVTDVFGQKTIVLSANQQADSSNEQNSWGMFNLSSKDSHVVSNGKLLLPPTVHKAIESKPIEEVLFARDEVSNIVWAIEKKVAGPLGNGVDWDRLSKEKKQFMIDKLKIGLPPALPLEKTNYVYNYVTGNTPENWIPFIVRNRDAENAIVLQRGVIQRNFPGVTTAIENIRPSGSILNENTNGNAYLLYNEEVPKEGIIVTRSYQRTRWYNGKIVNWLGRRKTAALGQIHNPLEFDTITNSNQLEIE